MTVSVCVGERECVGVCVCAWLCASQMARGLAGAVAGSELSRDEQRISLDWPWATIVLHSAGIH